MAIRDVIHQMSECRTLHVRIPDAYAPDLGLGYLDQEAVDLDVHWFATSQFELQLTSRFQMLEFGAGGNSSGYSQVHYRL